MSVTSNVEFRTILESACAINGCTQPAQDVAIVTGDYGTDSLAGYCPDCADGLAGSAHHTFIGEVSR